MTSQKNFTALRFVVFSLIFISLPILSRAFEVGSINKITLQEKNSFSSNSTVVITQQKYQQFAKVQLNESSSEWFIFIEVESFDEITWPDVFLNLYVQNIQDNAKIHHKKKCSAQGVQLQTCYLPSSDFDYKTQQILVNIQSDEYVSLNLKSELVTMKKIQLNTCTTIDTGLKKSESKLFKINLKQIAVQFQQIRITLTPINKMLYQGQPLVIFGSFGKYVPTPLKYDSKSFYAWQMGVVLKFFKFQLLERDQIYLLVDAPQNFLFDLEATIIQSYLNSIEVQSGSYYNDVITGLSNMRTFTIILKNPQLNNYIRIKKYVGKVLIQLTLINEWQKGYQNSSSQQVDMNYLTEFNNENYLSENNFKVFKGIKKFTLVVTCQNLWLGAIYSIEVYQNSKNYNWINQGATYLNQIEKDDKIYFVSRVIRHKQENVSQSQAQIRIFNKHGATSQKVFTCSIEDIQKCLEASKKDPSQQVTDGIVSQFHTTSQALDQVSEIKQISLYLTSDKFISYDDQYKQLIILTQVQGAKQFDLNMFSIQFMNVGIIDTLAQHQPKNDRIQEGQFKIYRFTVPNDTSIKSVIFHIQYFFGYVERFVTDTNPVGKTQDQLLLLMINQPLRFVREFQNSIQVQQIQVQKTYYLVVFGTIYSYVGIKVQLLKTMSHPLDQRNISYTTALISTLNSYKFILKPEQLILFDLSQMSYNRAVLRGSSTLPLDVCMNFQSFQLPIEPNCQNHHKMGKHYEMVVDLNQMKKMFSLYNGNTIQTSLTFSLQNLQKCVYRSIGQKIGFMARMFLQLQLKQLCISFMIYKKGDLLITIKPNSPLRQHSIKIQFKIGGVEARYITKLQTIIDAEQIDEGCQGQYDQCYASIIATINSQNDQTATTVYNQQLNIQLQYTDQPLQLADGMSHISMGLISATQPKHFKYPIYTTNEPLTIVLQNQRGYYKILAKIISVNQKYLYPTTQQYQNQQKTFTKQQFQSSPKRIYQSSNQNLYLYETLKLQVQYLKKMCVTMNIAFFRDCILLVSVYPFDKVTDSIPDGKFSIQIVQHVSVLKQHSPQPGYVQPGMLNCYEIYNNIQNSSIVIYANSRSNTKKQKGEGSYCFWMYTKFGIDQKATSSNSDHNSQKGEPELIITKAKIGTYSLTIQGLQSTEKYCDYQVQYAIIPPAKNPDLEDSTNLSIKSIKKGTPFSISMSPDKSENAVQYLMYYNSLSAANFKVLILFSTIGQVLINVMPLSSPELQNKFMNSIQDIDSMFEPVWIDSNSLEILSIEKDYCQQCLYIIKLECITSSKGEIIIPEQGSQISIKSNSIVYDQLLKDEKSLYRIYTSSHIAFKLTLISGQIEVILKNRQNNATVYIKSFKSSDEDKIQIIQLENKLDYEYNRYEIFQMHCKQNSHFIFGVLKDYNMSQSKNQTNKDQSKQLEPFENQGEHVQDYVQKSDFLISGVPKKVSVSVEQYVCLTAVYQDDPFFVLSYLNNEAYIFNPVNEPFNIQNLQIQFWVNSQTNNQGRKLNSAQTNFKKSQKSMLISFSEILKQNLKKQSINKLQMCLSANQPLNLSIIQSSHLNYLPSNTDIIVHQNINITFMAGEDTILEINQCSGHSLISISKDFSSVHTAQSQISQIRKSNSLIQFQQKGPIYVSTQSSGYMVINWREVNYKTGQNLGYFLYEPGTFRILPSKDPNEQMSLQILPLRKINFNKVSKSKQPTPLNLIYEVYVEKQELDLYSAMNCHEELGMKIKQSVDRQKNLQQDYIIPFYPLNEIKKQFIGYRYVLVSIKALLYMKNQITGQVQHYRFFYPYQELILSDLVQKEQSSSSVSIGTLGIGSAVIFFILILIIWQRKSILKIFKLKLKSAKGTLIQGSKLQFGTDVTQMDRYVEQKQSK